MGKFWYLKLLFWKKYYKKYLYWWDFRIFGYLVVRGGFCFRVDSKNEAFLRVYWENFNSEIRFW